MQVTVIPIVVVVLRTILKGFVKGLKDLEISGQMETIQTTAFLKIDQNTGESPGDLKALAVTQTIQWTTIS